MDFNTNLIAQTIVDGNFWMHLATKLIEGFVDNPLYLFLIIITCILVIGFLKSDKIVSDIIKGVQKHNLQALDIKLKELNHKQNIQTQQLQQEEKFQDQQLQQEQKLKEIELEHQRLEKDRKFKRDEDMSHSIKAFGEVLNDLRKTLKELSDTIGKQEEIIKKQTEIIDDQISIIKTFHERCRVHKLEIEREVNNLDLEEEEKNNILSVINCLPDVSYG